MLQAFVEHHPIAARVLLLTGIFFFGFLEGSVIKKREWACVTSFVGLGGVTAWIAYPLTIARVCLAGTTFAAGIVLMVIYYNSGKLARGAS
jgi:hypothetical protein